MAALVREIRIDGLKRKALEELSRKYLLALGPEEMEAIQAHYRGLGRNPTDIELETIAQTWSEHCIHKTFSSRIEYREDGRTELIENLLKETIFRATRELDRPYCLSVFQDNAGVVELDDRYALAFKVETHNHPSALEPYGGAGTGIGGVIRDVLGVGLGARPILNTDVFCFGPLDYPHDRLPAGVLHPRRIYKGVVSGVRDYGNRMGIPTANGAILFDPGFLANPLVFCGTLGLMPRDSIEKEVRPGDLILVIGGRTGRDGIHGATFSSLSLKKGISASVVQIGAPITEKRLADVLLVARDRRLYSSLTDCGAGGLSSAVGELGKTTGAEVHLEKVPLKYAGLEPWEIWVSEAQERMVLAVPPEHREEIAALCAAENVEATFIGRFTGTGELRLCYRGETVGRLGTDFLYRGLPRLLRQAVYNTPRPAAVRLPEKVDHAAILEKLLSHPNIASKEKVIRQYDHEVQGQTVIKPLAGRNGPSDAVVLKPLAASGRRGVAVANGINLYGRLDPYRAAANAIDEALRNLTAVGGDPDRASLLDNFCWGDVGDPEVLGALVRAARACRDLSLAYRVPFISGKDSLNNYFVTDDGRHLSVPPILLVSSLSTVPNLERAVTLDLKRAGSRLYLLGETFPELGGSHYLRRLGLEGGTVPEVRPVPARERMLGLHRAIMDGLVLSCHDLSEGGLAVAAAEMAFSGGLGLELDLRRGGFKEMERDDQVLFSESASRFLVEVEPDRAGDFEARLSGTHLAAFGRVVAEPHLSVIGLGGGEIIRSSLAELGRAWRDALPW
ncbi:MAG TPA: phosphoribosylformylglycinamidine synthase subunit PurL [bacterium]|nr:phosphoribosylformylglycinamidine synthase subunit PurL [bacterium]